MSEVNLAEQVKILVELQGLDTEILRMERELAYIPERLKEMDEEFKSKTTTLKGLEDKVKALQLKRKEREGDLEAKEGAVKKFQSQQYQVKTNKEYSALEQEIARAKADNSLVEEDIIRILDEIDAENKNISVEKESLKAKESALNAEKKKLTEEGEQVKARLATLKVQRGELAAKVDKPILQKYNRLLDNRDGLALARISDDSCQGCFRVMPPQVINEVRMKHHLVLCENCSRILYIEE